MPLSYLMINKRFDFAVPLEDIFTNAEIHPRLKFIFQQAFELYLDSQLNIKQILQEDHCLSKCLELKQIIICARQPGIHSQNFSTGSFFWIIRHFLGLLPISLLPAVTCDEKFPWKELSKRCTNFLQKKLTEGEHQLQSSIAKSLNNLPREHVSLLNMLVVFIREISKKKGTLKNVARYYCDSLFVRPFRPGHRIQDEMMLPLFIYIIIRWYRISRYLKIEHLNSDIFPEPNKSFVVNSSTQTNGFISDFPYVSTKIVKYLKDVGCQTDENDNVVDKRVQPIDSFIKDENVSLKTFTAHLNKRRTPSFVSSLVNIIEEENIQCEKCQRFDFFDNLTNERNNNWNDVVQEIARTVRRIEAQNYEIEDNDLRSSNDFKSDTSKLSESTFQSGTVDTVYETFKNSSSNDNNKTEDSSFKSIEDISKIASTRKNCRNISLYKSFYESDEELYNTNGEKSIEIEEEDEHDSSNFSLKRFKIRFLRTLSPKFKRSGDFRSILTRNIKYKKIKN